MTNPSTIRASMRRLQKLMDDHLDGTARLSPSESAAVAWLLQWRVRLLKERSERLNAARPRKDGAA